MFTVDTFARVINTGSKDANKTYATTYEGKSPSDLATITEGRQLVDFLQSQSSLYRKYGLALPPTSLMALGGAPVSNMIPIQEMLDAGFSPEKPIHLYFQVGNADPMEVFDNIYRIFSTTGGARELVLRGIFEVIDASLEANSRPTVNDTVEPPAPPAETTIEEHTDAHGTKFTVTKKK